MSLPVTCENDALRIEVWPAQGGKIASIIDKADKFNLMFDYPNELPTRVQYDRPFDDSNYEGWDECFPAVAPGPYPAHPYTNIPVPDHGELWGMPAVVTPTHHGITTQWHGLRFAYKLTRQLELDGPTLVARYSLTNIAPFPLHFVWAAHALMSLTSPVELELAGGKPWQWSHDAAGKVFDQPFHWPRTEEGLDLSRPATLPNHRGWKVFSVDPIDAPAVIRYPARGRQVELSFHSVDGLKAHWGVWLNTGGWAGNRHFAVTPCTGRFDQLDRCVKDHSAGEVASSGTLTWNFTLRVG